MSVVVLGSLNIDAVVAAERFPRPGETLIGGELSWLPGGKGLNQAVAAARLGASTEMVGCVGDDAFGPELIEMLRRDGVATSRVRRVEGQATGAALIVVDARGENSIVVSPGANHAVGESDVQPLEFDARSLCVAQLETPVEVTARAFSLARRASARTLLNAAPVVPLPDAIWTDVDLLVVNRGELAALAEEPEPQEVAETAALARRLRDRGVRDVAVTLGAGGVVVLAGETASHVPAHRVDVVDTTGAGDCFVGALAARLVEGSELVEAAIFANAAASLCVAERGAAPSMPSLAEVERVSAVSRPESWSIG